MPRTGTLGVVISTADSPFDHIEVPTQSSQGEVLNDKAEEDMHAAVLAEQLRSMGINTSNISQAMAQVRERLRRLGIRQ